MSKSLITLAVLGIFLLPSCASVGAVIEGGKEFTTGVIDGSVNAVATGSGAVLQDAADITATAAEVTSGVVDTVAENVDKQTDELQEKENSPKKD